MTSETPPQKDHHGWRDYLIAGATGIGAGVLVTAATVRREFGTDIGKIPDIKDLREELGDILQGKRFTSRFDLGSQAMPQWNGMANLTASEMAAKRGPHLSAIAKLKQTYHEAERGMLEAHGYRSQGLTGMTLGTLDRLRQMSAESRRVIFLSSTATIGVVTGAVLTYILNRHNSSKMDKSNEKLDELGTRLDALEAQKATGRG